MGWWNSRYKAATGKVTTLSVASVDVGCRRAGAGHVRVSRTGRNGMLSSCVLDV